MYGENSCVSSGNENKIETRRGIRFVIIFLVPIIEITATFSYRIKLSLVMTRSAKVVKRKRQEKKISKQRELR